MAWLLRDGVVLASLEVADTRRARSVGLLGREGFEGALLIPSCRHIHTLGMRFPIDVAYCDQALTVVRVVRMPRFRLGRPMLRPRAVIEAEAGMFERWSLRPGDRLEIKGG